MKMKKGILTATFVTLMFLLALSGLSSYAFGAAFGVPEKWTSAAGGNDHCYEVIDVSGSPTNWTNAKTAAESMSFQGAQGHLVTITSAAENAFLVATFGGLFAARPNEFTYIGASDAASEGDWRWVTGPEGLENAGAGRPFWSGGPSGSGGGTTAPDNFANWRSDEPNNAPGEDFGVIIFNLIDAPMTAGLWFDITNAPRLSYVVEYSECVVVNKEITSGPSDGSGGIAVVVEVKQTTTTFPPYDFDINYFNPGGPDVLIVDSVPAEWVVTAINGDGSNLPVDPGDPAANFSNAFGSVDVFRTGRGAKSKSGTKIHWTPVPNGPATINVEAEARQSPSGKVKFAPTSCGPLFLNSGPAEVVELVGGQPVQPTLFESNVLCLAAVEDLNGGGLVLDGTGDEDGDGFSDFQEACIDGTDPCDAGDPGI